MKFLSQVYTSVSGSVGGITYFNGRFGHMVARSRTIPTQPGSTPQTLMRTAWSNAQGLWLNATPLVRDQWDQYAATVTYQGPTGGYKINGRERFLATLSLISYMNLVFGLSIPATAVAPHGIGWLLISDLQIVPLSAVGTGFEVNVGNPNDHDMEVMVSISQPLDDTINFWKGPWDTVAADTLNVPSLTSAALVFNNLEAGKIYFIRVRAVSDTAEHRISESFILRGESAVYAP